MESCQELVKRLLNNEKATNQKSEEIMLDFSDDFETLEKSITNFTMNYQQSISMLESKHLLKNQMINQEIVNVKQKFREYRYQLQGENNQTKADRDRRLNVAFKGLKNLIEQSAREKFDNEIFKITLKMNQINKELDEKTSKHLAKCDEELKKTKEIINELKNKEKKDLSLLTTVSEQVEPINSKLLKGIELEEAKKKRQEYYNKKIVEIDSVINIKKHYVEKMAELEGKSSKIEIEKKQMPQVWMKQTQLELQFLEYQIKKIENEKSEYIEKGQIEFQYMEKKEKDSMLYDDETTITSLKEAKINEEFQLFLNEHERKLHRNEEIVSGSDYLKEYNSEIAESLKVFLGIRNKSTFSVLRAIYLSELRNIQSRLDLTREILNNHNTSINEFVTKEIEDVNKNYDINKDYLDFDFNKYISENRKFFQIIIEDSSSLVQQLKKNLDGMSKKIEVQINQMVKEIEKHKKVMQNISIEFYQKIISNQENQDKVLKLIRRNYVYKVEHELALNKALNFKVEAKPIAQKVVLHQKYSQLLDNQEDAKQSELKLVEKRTTSMELSLQSNFEKSKLQLEDEIEKSNKLLCQLIDSNDQSILRKKSIFSFQLDKERREQITMI